MSKDKEDTNFPRQPIRNMPDYNESGLNSRIEKLYKETVKTARVLSFIKKMKVRRGR